jgi:uncharacterized protein (DUF305 family)
MQTKLAFARNMARQHQSAIHMANAFLQDARGTNPIVRRLARAITRNRAFEITVLDLVRLPGRPFIHTG